MSLEKNSANLLLDPSKFIGKTICGYRIVSFSDNIGIFYNFVGIKQNDIQALCRVSPIDFLDDEWETKLSTLEKLGNIPQVIQYKDHTTIELDTVNYAFIVYESVKGKDLQQYLESCSIVTVGFVEKLLAEMLSLFQALKVTGITHGNLNIRNIIIADKDPRFINQDSRIRVADFGLSCEKGKGTTDDYQSLSLICSSILRNNIDPAVLEGEDRFVRDHLLTVFLEKQLPEDDSTIGDYVRNPEKLLEYLQKIRSSFNQIDRTSAKLSHPFDYLSCEHFGNSAELLQKLYSKHFPGYQELERKINTILTGPRGCGKTTIFKNLSLKTQLLGREPVTPKNYIGIYYHCIDISFAFPYKIEQLSNSVQKTITHFFNMAILCEVIDTLRTAEDYNLPIPVRSLKSLKEFLSDWLSSCSTSSDGTAILQNLYSLTVAEKERFRDYIDRFGLEIEEWPLENQCPKLMQQDFLIRLTKMLQKEIPWLEGLPFYVFLDDYSAPKVSEEVQYTLHNFILDRHSELFFKISTDSVVTFIPQDAKGRLCEEGREYEVIDLGDYFLHANDDLKRQFLAEIINNRLENAQEFGWSCRSIHALLGNSPYRTDVELAEAIKNSDKVLYAGWDTIVDLCSGDIANILRLIQKIFSIAKLKGEKDLPIPTEVQNQGIKETANEFFAKLKSIPGTGPKITEVVQAFGDVAHYYLKTRRSRNGNRNPPYQAFRLELLETPDFTIESRYKPLVATDQTAEDYSKVYEDLLRYGAFLRDVKGKSQRGAVVPRLYLRRLLIPTFLLTPCKRDHIRVNADEFKLLLKSPDKFKTHMIGKPFRDESPEPNQRRLHK